MSIRVMRRFLTIVVALSMLVGVLPASNAAGVFQEYLVENENGVPIYFSDNTDSVIMTYAPKGTILGATAANLEFIKTSYDGYIGWALIEDLTKLDNSNDVGEISGIEITKLPDKTEYYEDEMLETAGMVVSAKYKNGLLKEIKGYTVLAPPMNTSGYSTVTVLYKGFETSFDVWVAVLPIEKIEVTKLPSKLSYKQGSPLDFSDMEVTATLTDKTTRKVTNYKIMNYDPDLVGVQQVRIVYKTVYCNLPVEVIKRELVGVRLDVAPRIKTYYGTNFSIDLSGLKLMALYDNGDEEKVFPDSAVCKHAITVGTNTVILSYGGFTVQYDIEVEQRMPKGLSVSPPAKLSYEVGEEVDYSGLIVYLDFNDGSKTPIDDYNIITEFDNTKIGTQNITVEYEGMTAYFTLTVQNIFPYGDANGDGKVNVNDARLVLRFALGLESWSKGIDYCDVNGDFDVTIMDARLILQRALGLIPAFPIER